MWIFYHDVVSTTPELSARTMLGCITLLTGIIIMTPSYFEKKKG